MHILIHIYIYAFFKKNRDSLSSLTNLFVYSFNRVCMYSMCAMLTLNCKLKCIYLDVCMYISMCVTQFDVFIIGVYQRHTFRKVLNEAPWSYKYTNQLIASWQWGERELIIRVHGGNQFKVLVKLALENFYLHFLSAVAVVRVLEFLKIQMFRKGVALGSILGSKFRYYSLHFFIKMGFALDLDWS